MLQQTRPLGVRNAGQFVATSGSTHTCPADFRTLQLGRVQVSVHQMTPSFQADSRASLLLLGHVFDPRDPSADNQRAVDRLAACSDFDELEEATAGLAGRWWLMARFADECRLYPDAVGSRSIFHGGGAERVWAASQPGLAPRDSGVSAPPERLARLWQSRSANAWPAAHTPYSGARQLLPNHYLELGSGRVRRFWPTRALPALSLEAGVERMARSLNGTFRAIEARSGRAALPLTGGIDSRVLLACAGNARAWLDCFTVVDTATPLHDMWLPLRMARSLKLRFRFAPAARDAVEAELIAQNTGHLWRDPGQHRIPAFRSNALTAVGTVSEVCRCYYYPNGKHPNQVTAPLLASLAGWDGDSTAVSAYEEWLRGVPPSGIAPLDLFYWECRLGNWAAMDALALDAYADSFSPFNCRQLLETGLRVDVSHRCAPYTLHREICALMSPEIAELPINRTWLEGAERGLRRLGSKLARA
jgi:hypothetical protein